MALFFYIPKLIWRIWSVRSGIDLLDIVTAADDARKHECVNKRTELVKYAVGTINMYVAGARRHNDAENRQATVVRKLFQLLCCITGKFLGNYFITLYFFVK